MARIKEIVEAFILKYRLQILILLVGSVLFCAGFFVFKSGILESPTKIEVLNDTNNNNEGPDIRQDVTVEIAGAIISPGVYKLPSSSRIDDLLIKAGGFSVTADRAWTDKYLNRAAKLIDGQKIYIPTFDSAQDSHSEVLSAKISGGDQTVSPLNPSDSVKTVNINTATLSELDSLPGIGPVYGQNIIEHRMYSNVDELVSKGVLKPSVYAKIKDLVTVY